MSMPGKLCEAYRTLGGDVIEYGKPAPSHFLAAMHAAGTRDLSRVVHVGDSLKHDIAGAHAAGIDSIFIVQSGIHAEELVADVASPADSVAAVSRLAGRLGTPAPTYVLSKFGW